MFSIGDRIGGYEITAHLKVGGMATLFLATRRGAAGFTQQVAIKVIHPHLAKDPEFRRMFIDEAMLSAKLSHPNIVHVEELGEAEGTYYFVMEYVHGASLGAVLRRMRRASRSLSPELAVWIAAKIATGLHAAHEATNERGEWLGVVHRDLSPDNVLLTTTGHVKLIDFGIAKARGRADDSTVPRLKGKVRYMAPEQALGKDVDRRADIYSLGVILWEMLTMRRLFEADDDAALLELVRHPRVRPPSAVASWLTPELDEVVLSALAPDPGSRPGTAHELRYRLLEAHPSTLQMEAAAVALLLRPELSEPSAHSHVGSLGSPVESDPPVPGPLPTDVPVDASEIDMGDLEKTPSLPVKSSSAIDEAPFAEAAPEPPLEPPRPRRSVGRMTWIGVALAATIAAGTILARRGDAAANAGPEATPSSPGDPLVARVPAVDPVIPVTTTAPPRTTSVAATAGAETIATDGSDLDARAASPPTPGHRVHAASPVTRRPRPPSAAPSSPLRSTNGETPLVPIVNDVF